VWVGEYQSVDEDQKSKPSPEENLLHDLVNLAITIRDDGQVNPLTVVDVTEGVTRQYRIETGERRYCIHSQIDQSVTVPS